MAFRYHGGMVGAEREGKGRYLYPGGGFSYDGDWVKGTKHGKGEFRVPDGSVYTGQFVNGEIQGEGERVWPDGSRYKGTFFGGERNGHGSFYDAKTLEMYDGDWCNNSRTGLGSLLFPNGSRYIGTFIRDVRVGEGKYTSTDGSEYNGAFEDNLFHGVGHLTYACGSTYEGSFVNGKRQGRGLYECSVTGITYDGEWADDAPLERAHALVMESPGILQLSTEVQQQQQQAAANSAAATTVGGKGKAATLKKEEPKKGKQQPPDIPVAAAIPQLRAGTALPAILLKSILAGPSSNPGTSTSGEGDVASCESGRRLSLTLVKMDGETRSAPMTWFKRLPTITRVSEGLGRFPREICRSLFAQERDLMATDTTVPTPLTPAGASPTSNRDKNISHSLDLGGDAQVGERGDNLCLVLGNGPSATATVTEAGSVDWDAGVSLSLDMWVDAKAVVDKAAAGPMGPDYISTSMTLLTALPPPSSSLPSLSLLVTARLKEPHENRQHPEASLAIRVCDDESAPVVELVKDLPLDAWHAIVLTVKGSAVSLSFDGLSFERSLPKAPVAFGNGGQWRLGGNGFAGAVKNLGLYDRPLELATGVEMSACYQRLKEQEWRVIEDDARRKLAWEEAGSEGPAPEMVDRAAFITSWEVLTCHGQATAEDLVLPSQLAEGQYAICVEDKSTEPLVAALDEPNNCQARATQAFRPLPATSLAFIAVPCLVE